MNKSSKKPARLLKRRMDYLSERARRELTETTKMLVANGTRREELLWIISPVLQVASTPEHEIRRVWEDQYPEFARDVARHQSGCPQGHVACVYTGPEGILFGYRSLPDLEDDDGATIH